MNTLFEKLKTAVTILIATLIGLTSAVILSTNVSTTASDTWNEVYSSMKDQISAVLNYKEI